MLNFLDHTMLQPQPLTAENQALLKDAVWIDLYAHTQEEEELIENVLGMVIPTRAEMVEIEISSRLYGENGNLYMTAAMIAQSDSIDPTLDPVTFVLTDDRLITIRFIQPQSFKLFVHTMSKINVMNRDAITLFLDLLDATVDRLADILELVGRRLDDYSKSVFQPHNHHNKPNYQELMQQNGANADLNTKVRESLVTFNRLVTFFSQAAESRLNKEKQLHLVTLSKDIASLSQHADFLSTKINFLLDVTLGMINIEQNNIIKIFSVAAVIFLPPTLIASIYGMNFHLMPELSWTYGYSFALGLMVTAAWLPYKYFKHRKWL